MTQEELAEYLGNLNVLELIALTKTLDDMWEITPRCAPCPCAVPVPIDHTNEGKSR